MSHNQRLCNFFVDWRKLCAPNIRCFVINYVVSFLHSFCVKFQAKEVEKYCFSFNSVFTRYFHRIGPLGRFDLVVAMSVCLSVFLCV